MGMVVALVKGLVSLVFQSILKKILLVLEIGYFINQAIGSQVPLNPAKSGRSA
jgi:hypothetical protein